MPVYWIVNRPTYHYSAMNAQRRKLLVARLESDSSSQRTESKLRAEAFLKIETIAAHSTNLKKSKACKPILLSNVELLGYPGTPTRQTRSPSGSQIPIVAAGASQSLDQMSPIINLSTAAKTESETLPSTNSGCKGLTWVSMRSVVLIR